MTSEFYKQLLNQSPMGYAYHKIICDQEGLPIDYEFVEVNGMFEKLTGLKKIEIIGKKITDVLPDILKSSFDWIGYYGDVALNGTEQEFEQYSEPLHRWYRINVFSPEKGYFVTSFVDITKEKEQLDELQKNKDRLANILEGTNVGTWVWNVQTGETVFNERWAEIIGYTLEEISPVNIETWTRFVHLDDLDRSESQLQRVFNKDLDYYDVECRLKHKNGGWVWVQDRGKVTSWSADGKPIIVSGTHTDITERKRVEDDLQKSEYKLKEAQRLSHIGHWDWDYQKNILSWSDEVFNIFGFAIGEFEVSTENFENAIHPEDLQFFLSERKKALNAGNDVSIEHRIVRPDGEIRYVQERARIIRDDEENPLIILGTIQDITERKQSEEALRKSETRYRKAQELGTVGNWEYNLKTTEFWGSDEAKKMFGFDSSKDMFSLEEVESCIIERERVHQRLVDLIETSKPYNLEYDILTKNTSKTKTFVSIAELEKDEEGKPLGISGVIQDITDRKKADDALNHAMQQAEAANEAKSRFLANMSHEIRTPMNGFMGMIQLMQTTELTEEQQDFMRIAKSSTDRLLNVVNDILEYSRIEAGKIQFEKTTFNLGKMIKDTIDLFKCSTGLLIDASIENDVPDKLVGDSFRLNQIMSNLIGNAVKFTPKGNISIGVKCIKVQGNRQVKLEFVVKDTGIGIPHDRIVILFNSFSQVDSSITRVYGGSGLGLSICKGLVERMGGEIWVESIEGEGSSFYFTCVFETSVEQIDSIESAVVMQPQEQRDIRILIVEDDAVSRTVMEKLAARKDWKVTIAENGKLAIDIFKQGSFDIVLMDIQMPVMNGYETTGFFRELESPKGTHTPIIAMTAFALKGDREKCLEAGMDDYLSKPVYVNEFYAAVEKWTTNGSLK